MMGCPGRLSNEKILMMGCPGMSHEGDGPGEGPGGGDRSGVGRAEAGGRRQAEGIAEAQGRAGGCWQGARWRVYGALVMW